MNHFFPRLTRPAALTFALTVSLSTAIALHPALAAPGAHGPNGEHLDSPVAQTVASALPRLEATTEAFELVATLHAKELSVLIDRFDTNEPVLGATLELEVGDIKAQATFRANQGDYAFDDVDLLALLRKPADSARIISYPLLRKPAEHALVFTLLAGAENDLLDGTLVTTAAVDPGHAQDEHGHDHTQEVVAWSAGGTLMLGLAGAYVWRHRRARQAAARKGAR